MTIPVFGLVRFPENLKNRRLAYTKHMVLKTTVSDAKHWFSIVNNICKLQSCNFAYTKCMVLQVSLTGRPFKNAVKYDNSVFPTTSFAFSTFLEQQVSLKSVVPLWKLARRLDETHGSESVTEHRFTIVIYICKRQSGHFTYIKCMVL